MRVYRVEDLSGWGPYRSLATPSYVSDILYEQYSMGRASHPTPINDGIPDRADPQHYRFGFASMRSLLQWFPIQAREALHRAHFTIGVYEVVYTDVFVGVHQVCFRASTASKQGMCPIWKRRGK